jgi:hypothetical protein
MTPSRMATSFFTAIRIRVKRESWSGGKDFGVFPYETLGETRVDENKPSDFILLLINFLIS